MSTKSVPLLLILSTVSVFAEPVELFVRRIEPMIKAKCFACHGDDPAKIKADYDMRSHDSLFRGGESDKAAIKPSKPEESPFYLSITRVHEDDWKPMPPKENDKLSAEQVGWVKEWIAAGAPWPNDDQRKALAKLADKWSAEEGIVVQTKGALSPDWANRRYKAEGLWAYQPVKKPVISSSVNPIDALIAARIPKDVKPAPACDPRTFIRRATFDLLGLPPTPEEVAAFVQSSLKNPDTSIKSLIDRLLESPHYGERWGRHWLDVVRYADSSGFANDYERGNAWRYRDYVVRAFNSDKPYDQFIKEQIAGDEIDPNDPEKIIATGFLRMGPWELTGMEVAKIARQRFLDDVTNSVGETFLSHSLQCARCHDHKFDPVPTHDYYSIQAVFGTTQLVERTTPFQIHENVKGFEERKYIEARQHEHEAELTTINAVQVAAAKQWFADQGRDASVFEKALKLGGGKRGRSGPGDFTQARNALMKSGVPEDQLPPRHLGFTPELYGRERVARKGLERVAWELARYEPVAFAVYDGRTPEVKAVLAPIPMPMNRMTEGELEQTAILAGGDPFSPTAQVQPNVLSVLTAFNPSCTANIPTGIEGRRKALAEWIAREDNPLTTRSIINRLWMWHFGQPIAGNPNNFGSTGKKPTHPELLDWLAATLVEQHWSLKALHRLIMTSEAYGRSSSFTVTGSSMPREEAEQTFAAFKPRRLTAEEFRDTMLLASGELNPEIGGIPNRPEMNLEAALQPRQVMGTFAAAWQPNPLPAQRHRRSLYALKIRGLRDPLMEVLNEPAPDFSCERRDASTVTPQVFAMFNSEASYDRALALADRVLKEKHEGGAAIGRLFQLAFGRAPSADETRDCLAHWQAMTKRHEGLHFEKPSYPQTVKRDAVEENTGEKFSFAEQLDAYADFIPDLKPSAANASTRGLAEIALVLINSNEFAYVY